MIRHGLARVNRRTNPSEQSCDFEQYLEEEDIAKHAKLGIWASKSSQE